MRTLWLPGQRDSDTEGGHVEAAQLRHTRAHLAEDVALLRAGVLDRKSFRDGYRPMVNPVEVKTTSLIPDEWAGLPVELLANDPGAYTAPALRKDGCWGDAAYGMRRRCWRQIRRQHNLQLTVGKNQIQRIHSFGDVGSGNGLSGFAGTGSGAATATTWTGTGTAFPTATSSAGNAGLQGHAVFVANALSAGAFTNPVLGIILSNTATVLTVDQWYLTPLTGAAGTTPGSAAAAFVLPGGTWAWWVALSTNSAAAAAGDVTRSADGLWADGTSAAAATELVGSGMDRAYCGQGGGTAPTIPGSGQIALNHTWTYSGSTLNTVYKVVMFNSKAAAGTIPLLETLLNAAASVAANGDTIQLSSWTITC